MRLALGYVPLVDAAALIVAVEGGFAAAEGLAVDLVREPSWATLRDKLALGHLDGAHMLAPLALASTLGISGPETRLAVPLALNLNGNAITVSRALWAAMSPDDAGVDTVARAFARVARARAEAGRPLTLGTVHPFSSHTYQLRLFAARGGLDRGGLDRGGLDRGGLDRGGLGRDGTTRTVVIPPPRIAEALRAGHIDGFCAGSPWNSLAVEDGYGRIAAFGCELAPECPEKVLALPADAAPAGGALVRAVRRAGEWCAQAENHGELADLLAGPDYLALAPALIRRALAGTIVVDPDGTRRDAADFVVFGPRVEEPRVARVDWLLDQMAAAGQLVPTPALTERARTLYRPDLYAAAVAD